MAGEFDQFQRYVKGRQAFDAESLLKKLQAQERLAELEHGVGGSADRAQAAATGRAGMQFGPGGSDDRQREILRPYYAAQATRDIAEAGKVPSEIAKLAAESGLIGSQTKQTGADTVRLNMLTRLAGEKWDMFEKPQANIDLGNYKTLAPEMQATALAREAFMRESTYKLPEAGITTPPVPPVGLPVPPVAKNPWYFQGAGDTQEEQIITAPPFLKRRGDADLYNRAMRRFSY